MTAQSSSASAFSPHAGSHRSRPHVVLDDTSCVQDHRYPHELRDRIRGALRITTPDRILVTTQESRSPWWKPVAAELGVRVLTLPVERGLGLHLAVAALELSRVDPHARAVFLTTTRFDESVAAYADGAGTWSNLHRVESSDGATVAVVGSAAAFAAHVAAADPDGFELLLFAVACSTDQERPELLDSTFLYLEHLDDARWLPSLPAATPLRERERTRTPRPPKADLLPV